MRTVVLATLAGCVFVPVEGVFAADPPTNEPRPVPLTRPEMKQLLEDMKARKPRIPLPALTEDEKAKLGEREAGYEARLRALYLPEGWGFGGNRPAGGVAPAPGGLGRNTDPNMTL